MESELLINNKINDLENAMKSSKMERDNLLEKIGFIEESINTLSNINVSFKDYDFTKILDILNENNVKIENLEQTINDVKNIAEFRALKGYDTVELYDEYKKVIDKLKSKLENIKEQMNIKLSSIVVVDYSKDIDDLNDVMSFINGDKNVVSFNEQMLKTLYIHIISKNSLESLMPLYKQIYDRDTAISKSDELELAR